MKKKITGTILFVSWLAIYQWKKITENCNSLGAGAHKLGKVDIKKYVYNSTVIFFNILLFCLKGYSEILNLVSSNEV